jgi:hypothetical protein
VDTSADKGVTLPDDPGINPSRRSLELDCLRGWAILLVLFRHQITTIPDWTRGAPAQQPRGV